MAHLSAASLVKGKRRGYGAENDESEATTDAEGYDNHRPSSVKAASPILFHKVQNQRSILALLVSDLKLYAGTQNGDLLVCC